MNWSSFSTMATNAARLEGWSNPSFYRAAQLFHMATNGDCRLSFLAGDSMLNARRDIMTALRGRQATVAQSTLTAVRKELLKYAGIDTHKNCQAVCESTLRTAIQSEFN